MSTADDGLTGGLADETQLLRRCLRDVVALTALPSVWSGYDTRQICTDVVDLIARTLDPDAVYLTASSDAIALVHLRDPNDEEAQRLLREAATGPIQSEQRMTGSGGRELRILSCPLSPDSADRLLLAAWRSDFPNEMERLLLRVAANQASTWIERKNAEAALASESARREALAVDNASLYRQAQEANRAKDEFLANLSHELRTPMTAILGWAHLLQVGDLDADQIRLGIETIKQSGAAQAKLIDELLDVSRIVTGKLQLTTAMVRIPDIVQAAVAAIRPAAEAKRQSLELETTGEELWVRGDAARLQQVFWNLLSNAVKFTPPGGSVHVRVEPSDPDFVAVAVSDSGEGIAAEFLPQIFERFRQLATGPQGRSGLGLGLAIAKELVELHGGSLRVASEGERQGSTFTVTLPRAAAEPATFPAGNATKGSRRLSGVRILLVEDDEATRTLLATLLASLGAVVTAASSAKEAREAMETSAPDVLISDIELPGGDGITLLQDVRRRGRGTLPAIAVTGYADERSRERILAAGFNGFVAKPLDPLGLADEIARVLRVGEV
jgi:signal transduction histidine kinase